MSRVLSSRRAAGAVALACAAVAVAASPATAQTAAPAPAPHTITVTGIGQVKPKPRDKQSNASIKNAVAKARRAAIPLAIGNGQGRAVTLAQLSGLTLGELISIAAAPFTGPFYGPYFGEDGTFGPGEYCGTVRRPIFRTDAGGRRRVVGTRSRRQCRIPQYVTASLTMVFSAA